MRRFRAFRLLGAVVTLGIVVVALGAASTERVEAALPSGFVIDSVLTNLQYATDITWARDGRLFVALKDGRVQVYKNGVLQQPNFLDISAEVNNYVDRGLLSIALHPDFPTTPYVYLLYVYDPPGVTPDGTGARVSRLIRVTADPNNTSVALPNSTVVLLGKNSTRDRIGDETRVGSPYGPPSCDNAGTPVNDCIPVDGPSHSVGMIAFAPDGSLFVTHGDGSDNVHVDKRALRSGDINSLAGKLLHIDPSTGNGLSTNPFYSGNPTDNRSKVWSFGLRNPFSFALRPASNSDVFIGDVGWGTWEELNQGQGKNFGWPCYEGNNSGSLIQSGYQYDTTTRTACQTQYSQGTTAVQAPIYSYSNTVNGKNPGQAIMAGTFYEGTSYPSQYRNALFIADYNSDWIKYVTLDAAGKASVADFATDVSTQGGPLRLRSGPDSNLYFISYNYGSSQLRRIRYVSGGNTPPTARASATPTSGTAPLTVQFSSSGSTDPEGQALTYQWTFGDNTTLTAANPTHTFNSDGVYTVQLRVTDTSGASGVDQVVVTVGNTAPTASITTPAIGTKFNVGQVIQFSGMATDAQDGTLPGSSMHWEVLLHHNEHVHPNFFEATGISGSFVAPDHGDTTWLELCLSVTDSGGLQTSSCRAITPNTSSYTFDTVPSGLTLTYGEGVTRVTPFTVAVIVNSRIDVSAPLSQNGYTFSSWSDGGASSHSITVGTTSRTIVASYQQTTTPTNTPVASTYGSDSFARSVTNGWGTADLGDSYALSGTAADFAVASGVGTIALPARGVSRGALLPAISQRDVDISLRAKTDKPSTGSGQYLYLVARRQSSAVEYRGKLRIAPSGTVYLQAARLGNGTETVLSAEKQVPGLVYTPGQYLRLRMEVSGASPTTIRIKVWDDGQAEPSAWQYTQTDSTAALQTAGNPGIFAYLSGSATNAPLLITVDDLLIAAPGSVTVTPTAQPTTTPIPTATSTPTIPPTITSTPQPSSTPTKAPTNTPVASTYGSDSFARSVTNGWGTADLGDSYALSGTAADFAVASGVGTIALPARGVSRGALLPAISQRDVDISLRAKTDKPSTGSGQYLYLVARRQSSAVEYRGKLRIAPSGTVYLQAARLGNGTETVLSAEKQVPGLVYTPGQYLRLRMEVSGASPTTIRIKVWDDGQAEPSAWQYTQTDSTAALQTAGNPGIFAYLSGSATNAPLLITVDDLLIAAP